MRSLYLAVICFFLSFRALAQTAPAVISIHGTVIDSAVNKPMGFVTVALQNSKTHAGVKSVLSKDDGSFTINAPAGNSYDAVFVFIGYRNKTVSVPGSGGSGDLGKILLAPASNQLKEVSVTAARPL
ncbi:MAG: carboxypeptidase-like regulatory domain-containing protein, partial [Bacteroidetes bacterium]|nr:carboxypeptidase-like regulatory domain-containing protein [Bacteroidota bacterium]